MRKFDTVNGVAANGMLFVVAGCGRFGEVPGNVLLAFKPGK
jgi:hypothetical protein